MTNTSNSNTPTTPPAPPVNTSSGGDKNNPVNISESLSIGWELFKNNIFLSVSLNLVLILIYLIQFIPFIGLIIYLIINAILMPGIIYVFVKIYDNQPTSFGDIFKKVNKIFFYMGAQIIIMLITSGGSLFLLVPGLIALIALMFTFFLLIDKNMSIIGSVRTSWTITKGYRWKLFLFFILSILIYIPITVLTLRVGSFIIIPIIFFSMIHIYRKLLAQAEKSNKLPVTKLQTWPKVFLWASILIIPLGIISGIIFVSIGAAREKAQEYKMEEIIQSDVNQKESTPLSTSIL